jgi:competence protein ComEC
VDTAPFVFTVVDVGDGLAQLGVRNSTAVAWDVGDTGAVSAWQSAFSAQKAQTLGAIIISHTHRDHYGNLACLPAALNFSGLIVISPCEDSTLLRNNSGAFHDRLFFRTIAQGDTLGLLDGVYMECLWPPRNLKDSLGLTGAIPDSLKNRYSLCFLVRFQGTSLIITSDIDSIAEKILARSFGLMLAADLLVVPHHGSASGAEPLFFGCVHPQKAVISCGFNNPYGHPASAMLDLLFEEGAAIMQTSLLGTITEASNGFYWQ